METAWNSDDFVGAARRHIPHPDFAILSKRVNIRGLEVWERHRTCSIFRLLANLGFQILLENKNWLTVVLSNLSNTFKYTHIYIDTTYIGSKPSLRLWLDVFHLDGQLSLRIVQKIPHAATQRMQTTWKSKNIKKMENNTTTHVLPTRVQTGLCTCNKINGMALKEDPVPRRPSNLKIFPTIEGTLWSFFSAEIGDMHLLHYAQASLCASSRQLQFTKSVIPNVRGVFILPWTPSQRLRLPIRPNVNVFLCAKKVSKQFQTPQHCQLEHPSINIINLRQSGPAYLLL